MRLNGNLPRRIVGFIKATDVAATDVAATDVAATDVAATDVAATLDHCTFEKWH
jgi:hypothetical protein